MNEWKVVPVEPSETMLCVADEHPSWMNDSVKDRWRAMVAAAPTPPVVLPPLPGDVTLYGDEGGPVAMRRVFNFTRDQMHDYARAALAQYGIKEQNNERPRAS